jgi:hypothetical protein
MMGVFSNLLSVRDAVYISTSRHSTSSAEAVCISLYNFHLNSNAQLWPPQTTAYRTISSAFHMEMLVYLKRFSGLKNYFWDWLVSAWSLQGELQLSLLCTVQTDCFETDLETLCHILHYLLSAWHFCNYSVFRKW